MVPFTEVKETCDCNPQKSSLPVTQTNAAQVPLKTPILVSYAEPQRLKVTIVPSPTNVYQTPGAVFKVVTQVGTASKVAPTVVPVIVDRRQLILHLYRHHY